MKRLAIQLYGHVRTYEQTSEMFFKNLVLPNKKDDWEIDIFIHTWSEFSPKNCMASVKDKYVDKLYPTLTEKKILISDYNNIVKLYNPKRIVIDEIENLKGRDISYRNVVNLRLEYSQENRIIYDIILTTRPDIYFKTPIRINDYLSYYKNNPEMSKFKLENFIFCGHQNLRRMIVSDPRYVNEADLFFFTDIQKLESICVNQRLENILLIPIKYILNTDFFVLREACNNLNSIIEIREK